MIKKITVLFTGILFLAMAFSCTFIYGDSTQNGITVKNFETKTSQWFQAEVVDSFDPDGTEVYNPASGVAITSGSINTTEYTDDLTVQISVPTLGSTGIDVTAYGQFTLENSAEGWVDLWTESISTPTTTLTLEPVTIEEKPVRFRVGVKSTGSDGTDDVTVLILGRGPAQ